ncbi:WD repeat-containing protein-like protein [Hyaloscypha hepaticicola]|uniref:WD repeat-containing protein-like protein n=1 Tax=Hyaloscypha hepaticicola TaxID=2082293 RepID=A0A2J6Q7A9_9HELO|nr:WD repeat-containing protein-like protein [Hyaloscypha hepaticicola]
MSSTPMAIDSPMGANGLGSKSAGALPTAKLSEMIPLYRPSKHFRRDPPSSVPGKTSSSVPSVLSLDFDDEGALLLTSESDNSMQIYNVKEGKHHKTLLSQKYGVMHAMFGHASGCIIHSSTKQNNTIRYLSTHDNSYLRYFEGHEKNVTCLSLHPGQDNFLSCSEDNTLRIWDAATKNACGKLNLHGAYLAAWDPSGNVFAVASPTAQAILLYDFRNFDREPFSTFDMLPYSQTGQKSLSRGWNKLEFSNDGKHILVGTTGNQHYLLDAFDGHLKASLLRDRGGVRRLGAGDHNPDSVDSQSSEFMYPSTGDCCFTPDGRYVVSGSRQQNVLVWDTLASAQERFLRPVHELEYKEGSAVIAFNPRYNIFATGEKEVVFWVPDQSLA